MRYVYVYDGPVLEFDKCISKRWFGETTANSVAEAKRNLMFQYKKQHKRTLNTKILLPGDILVNQIVS